MINHTHKFILDVPHYFSKQDDPVEEHYEYTIKTREHDSIFVHLVCPECYEEAHTVMDVEELRSILDGAKIIQSKLKLL